MTDETPPTRRIVYFFRGEKDSRDSLADALEQRACHVEQVPISDFAPLRGLLQVFRHPDLSSYDVVAAAEYHLAWAVCLRLLLHRHSPKVAALSFNQSRRLVLTGIHLIDRLLNRIWRRASLFLVHSRQEVELFSELHDIPRDRFVFSHWGYDLPAHDSSKTKVPEVPYVTMIGRNNRDIATFCAAVERAGVSGVLITAAYMLDRSTPGEVPNVTILTDRPMEECLSYVEGSFAHLVLVTDAERGAGHISAVSAMLLGKPQIFSDVSPLQDYLSDGVNGIAVPIADVESVVVAIRRLHHDRCLSERLGRNGRDFALEHLSYDASSTRAADALLALVPKPC